MQRDHLPLTIFKGSDAFSSGAVTLGLSPGEKNKVVLVLDFSPGRAALVRA